MLQLSFKQSNLQSQLILGCKADDGLHTAGKGNRDGAGTLANQFQKMASASITAGFCKNLLAFQSHFPFKKVRIIQNGKDGGHTLQIVLIVKNQQIVQLLGMVFQIGAVYIDKLTAGVLIGS